MSTTGICFNIQRSSIHDGPGIRTTVFLKGCPLSCTWCHNPEGLSPNTEILIVPDRCIGCGACVEACPNPPITDADGRLRTDRSRCLRCGSCVEACIADARRMVGTEMTVEELIHEVERDRAFYEESGGGVTFSGGEPFAQPEFLMECLAVCRERSIHTAVDTSGFAPRELLLKAAALTDLFLFDLKLMDDRQHQRLTGVPAAPIVENLRALDDAGTEIWIRFPLIPGVTDDMENVETLGKTLAPMRTDRVHVLPFHRTAADKYARIEREWDHGELDAVPEEEVSRIADALTAMGLEVRIGG